MVDGNTRLRDHAEFGMTRDVVALCKFMATMETREQELMARQKQREGWCHFRFHLRRGRAGGLNFKGVRWESQTTGKGYGRRQLRAFGGRKLFFGKGAVVQSLLRQA